MNLKRNIVLSGLCAFLSLSGCKKDNPAEPVNNKPVLIRVTANPQELFPERTSTLECIVEDDDDGYLSYLWDKDGGYFDSNSGKKVIWHAPIQIGEYHITSRVEDIEERWSDSRTITLDVVSQYDTLYVSEDAYVDQENPNFNSQTDIEYEIRYLWLVGTNENFLLKYPYFRFGLDGIKNNRDIKSANLNLKICGGAYPFNNPSCYIYESTQPWGEETITYNNQPRINPLPKGYFELPLLDIDTVSLDITKILEEWINNSSGKYGFCMRPSGEMQGGYPFVSKEANYGGSWHMAFISIEYK